MIAGHVAIDHIHSSSFETTSIGGPPSYAGLMARQLGFEVLAVTKVGYDLPDEYAVWLSRNQLNLAPESRSRRNPTTRFRIDIQDNGRTLRLLSRCEGLEIKQLSSSDAIILSGIANEISGDFAERASRYTKFLFLDPQTFLRSFSPEGHCLTKPPEDLGILSLATCLKSDREEALLLTGQRDVMDAAKALLGSGIHLVLITDRAETLLATEGEIYSVIPPHSDAVDTTGAGDIFGGSFVASFLRTNDPLWALCVAASASSLAVRHVGISKIPDADTVFQLAESTRRSVVSRGKP